MIYYPIALLLLAGIRHILVVSTPRDVPHFQQCLGGGEQWGINLSYAVQSSACAAQALVVASEFTGDRPLALAPGNQIVYGPSLAVVVQKAATLKKGARIFARRTDRSQPCAATGLAFYDHTAAGRARELAASQSGRLDITALNNAYLAEGAIKVEVLDDEVTWLAIDSHDSLLAATGSVERIEKNQGVKAGCPEEAAWRMGFIGDEALLELADGAEGRYGRYLRQLPENRDALR